MNVFLEYLNVLHTVNAALSVDHIRQWYNELVRVNKSDVRGSFAQRLTSNGAIEVQADDHPCVKRGREN